MRRFFILLLVCLLLSGCRVNPAAMEGYTPTAAPTEPETQPPTTVPLDPMEQLLDSMSTEQLVGQLFLARYPGYEAAKAICEGRAGNGTGTARYYVSDDPEMFISSASRFLGRDVKGQVSYVDIGAY